VVTGSLQEKSGTYYAVIRIPDNSGKYKQKWISTGVKVEIGNKKQANARLREIIVDYDRQKIVYSADIQFLDWIDTWMEQKKNEVRLNTYESYESNLEVHITPYFKPLKLTLRDITPIHIQNYYNGKIKSGQSANSVWKHNVIIRGALEEAMKKNLIPYNPADRATLPRKKKYTGKAYTASQVDDLLEVISKEPMKPAMVLGVFYGLRRSEVLGLRWRDIDFKEGTIHIRNTVVKMKTLVEAEQTKSDASKRTMYIIPETKEYLLSVKRRQTENRLLMGSSYHVSDHVCTWDDGSSFTTDYISKRFVAILANNNLPRIRFHDLRDTAGSLLFERGLSAKQVQEFLGHENVSTTLNMYVHLSVEGKKEAASVMGNLLTATSAKLC